MQGESVRVKSARGRKHEGKSMSRKKCEWGKSVRGEKNVRQKYEWEKCKREKARGQKAQWVENVRGKVQAGKREGGKA